MLLFLSLPCAKGGGKIFDFDGGIVGVEVRKVLDKKIKASFSPSSIDEINGKRGTQHRMALSPSPFGKVVRSTG